MTNALKAYPYTHFVMAQMDDADILALTAADDDLTDAAFAAGELTVNGQTFDAAAILDVKGRILEFTPSNTDDDNPVRTLAAGAVRHDKGYEDWTATIVMEIASATGGPGRSATSGIMANLAESYIAYIEVDGWKLCVVFQLFDPTRVPGRRMAFRMSMRNISERAPVWSV